jgi:hypothetical protein
MKTQKLSLGKSLNRNEMREVLGGLVEAKCKTTCAVSNTNSGCCSGVAATDIPYCGSGRRCL